MFEEQDYIGEDIAIPGLPTSVWLGTSKDYKYQSVDFLNTAYDLVIVGAGIAGLTTAYALSNSKKKILILDMGNVSRDVTGHTTAKVTSLHGLTYDFLIKKFGKETARLYGESQEEAIKLLSEIIKNENIECGFRKAKAIMYSMTPEGAREIKKEVEAAKKLGLPVCEKKDFSLPFEPLNTICFENQAQFHPTKYIFELAKRLNEKGVNIAEGVRVVSVNEKEELVEIQTTNGDIKTKQVVITTHFPIYDKGSFFAKLEARRAYAYAVKLKGDVPEGLYYCIDEPKYSFRPFDSVQDKLFIISGEGHKAGQANEEEKYLNLQDFANKYFDIESFDYHWSTQDNYPPDKIPFIGLSPNSKRVFMATGFRGWGMTNGTLSGFVLADLIRGRKNIYADIFNPSRKLSKVSSTKGLFAYNVNVAKELFVGKIKRPERFALPTELKVGGGSIVEYGGEKVAAFKDENSELHVLSPKCTHMGCNVKWNNAEKTWDCPCHGSRYSSEGKVIHSPAMRDLEQKNE